MNQPGYSEDAEDSVIGSCIIGGLDTFHRSRITGLSHSDFAFPMARIAYMAFEVLSKSSTEIDLVTVTEAMHRELSRLTVAELGRMGVTAPRMDAINYLRRVVDMTPTKANILHYAGMVKECCLVRDVRTSLASLHDRSKTATAQEIIEGMLTSAASLSSRLTSAGGGAVSVSDVVDDAIRIMSRRKSNMKSGVHSLDALIGGLQPATLYGIAARPGGGKTTFLNQYVLEVATKMLLSGEQGQVVYATYELPKEELVAQMLHRVARINTMEVRQRDGAYTSAELARLGPACRFYRDLPIRMIDRNTESSLTVERLFAMVSKLQKEVKGGVKMLVVDYFQNIDETGGMDNRERELTHISKSLLLMTQRLRIPILCSAQLRRTMPGAPVTLPDKGQIAECDQFAKDVNTLVLISPDIFQPATPPGIAEQPYLLVVAKNRYGAEENARCTWFKQWGIFSGFSTLSAADVSDKAVKYVDELAVTQQQEEQETEDNGKDSTAESGTSDGSATDDAIPDPSTDIGSEVDYSGGGPSDSGDYSYIDCEGL